MAAKRYVLVAGSHVDRDGVKYHSPPGGPPVIVTSEDDLVKMFPGKFVPEAVAGQVVVNTDHALGNDVTEMYEIAQEAGLKVYAGGGYFHVVDPDRADAEPLNEKGLRGNKVSQFIEKWMAEQE